MDRAKLDTIIAPLPIDDLREQYARAEPFPFVRIDNFLVRQFADKVAASYPTFDDALRRGFAFDFVNEKKKVQITDPERFPEPVADLHAAISSRPFLDMVSAFTGIDNLLADEELIGAGMHVTGPQGRLDVHVDFNLVEKRQLHRRLNILIYLNPEWHRSWGGAVELWDRQVKHCHHSIEPKLGRCVIFETSERSFHGVTAVTCPSHQVRRSFAAYYYTKEPPPGWDGRRHSTIFKARPDERFRGYVLMPLERAQRELEARVRRVRAKLGAMVGRQ